MNQEKHPFVVAIDGPAGSGKSTTAKRIAHYLKCVYIDTGSMYRAAALYLLKQDISIENTPALSTALQRINISIVPGMNGEDNKIILNKKDVSQEIRTPEITRHSSFIATNQLIRQRLVELQRSMAQQQSVIMDGRDIGTVVFPHAQYKFFLTASLEARAHRRFLELQEKGNDTATFLSVKEELAWRDANDTNRKIAPLRKADDAIVVDTTAMTIDEQVAYIVSYIKNDAQ